MDMLLNPSAANIAKRDAEMGKNADSIDKLVKAYKGSRLTEKEQQVVPKFEAALNAYRNEGLTPAREALRAGDTDTASKIYKEAISARLATPLTDALSQLTEIQVEAGNAQYAQAEQLNRSTRWMLIGLTATAFVVGALLALRIAHSVTQPIDQAVDLAQRVADGDLSGISRARGRRAGPAARQPGRDAAEPASGGEPGARQRGQRRQWQRRDRARQQRPQCPHRAAGLGAGRDRLVHGGAGLHRAPQR